MNQLKKVMIQSAVISILMNAFAIFIDKRIVNGRVAYLKEELAVADEIIILLDEELQCINEMLEMAENIIFNEELDADKK